MPTYEDLRAYFQESGDLQEVARRASTVPIVSGFTIDIDPLWSFLYDLENNLDNWSPEMSWWPADWSHFLNFFKFDDPWNLYQPLLPWARTRYQGYRRRNLHATVEAWQKLEEHYKHRTGRRRLPLTMTIVHRPVRPPREADMEEGGDQEALRSLVALVREASVAVRVEERPRARFALAGGDGIKASRSKSGTLGGALEDCLTKKLYGVSCAHVAKTGDAVTDSSAKPIGTCNADTRRVPLPAVKVCDPVNLAVPSPAPGNGPDVNMLDCALIELTVPMSNLPIAGVAHRLSPGQNVVLHGAATRTTRHKLGSLAISYSFAEGGQDFCFRDAIELLPQPWGPFGGTLGHMMTKVPTQGDSGGWVLTDDDPADWVGLFFGEDGQRGFAIRASWVHDWAEKTVGCSLSLCCATSITTGGSSSGKQQSQMQPSARLQGDSSQRRIEVQEAYIVIDGIRFPKRTLQEEIKSKVEVLRGKGMKAGSLSDQDIVDIVPRVLSGRGSGKDRLDDTILEVMRTAERNQKTKEYFEREYPPLS